MILENEIHFRRLFEQSNDAILIFSIADEVVIEANKKAEQLFGISREELLGAHFTTYVDPKEKEQAYAQWDKTLKGDSNAYERKGFKKSGEPIVIQINNRLISDSDGNPIQIQAVLKDITESIAAEKALRASEV
ncbi:MAG: PAS domain S-box protein, partial [Chloroflexota bacterium]